MRKKSQKNDLKRLIATVLMFLVVATGILPTGIAKAETEEEVANNAAVNATTYALNSANTLYIDGCKDEESTNDAVAWRYSSSRGKYYLYIPSSADLSNLKIWHTFNSTVTVNGKTLVSGETTDVFANEGEYTLYAGSTSYKVVVMKSENIPAMFLTTKSKSYADLSSSKSVSDSGNAVVGKADGSVDYSGAFSKIKGRGNSTWDYDKKPFNLTLDKKASLLGSTKTKKYSLLANYRDQSLLRNQLMYDLANDIGLDYTPNSNPIDLYVNGEYFGTYELTEKVESGKDKLVGITDLEKNTEKVNDASLDTYSQGGTNNFVSGTYKYVNIPNDPEDITGGYLMEFEVCARYADELCGFVTKHNQPIIMKSPECISKAQSKYISEFYQEFEDALFSSNGYNSKGKYYTDYIDVESFAKMYLIQELSKNLDGAITSFYIYKDSDLKGDGKLHAAPVWDFDVALGNYKDSLRDTSSPTGLWIRNGYLLNWNYGLSSNPTIFNKLFSHSDFNTEVENQWSNSVYPKVNTLFDETNDTNDRLKTLAEYKNYINSSANMNFDRWKILGTTTTNVNTGSTYNANIDYVYNFLNTRSKYLNKQYSNIETSTTVYFDNTNSKWSNVYAYVWTEESVSPVVLPLTLVDGETNIYKVTVSSKYEQIIFKNTDGTSSWNIQTTDQLIPTSKSNCYKPTSSSNKSAGSWYEYTEPVKEFEITSFKANPDKETSVGQDITLSVETKNNASDVNYVFSYTNETTSETNIISDSSDNTVTFKPSVVGNYTFKVEANDGTKTVTKTIEYTVKEFEFLEITSLESSLGTTMKTNSTTKLTVNAINGYGNNLYTIRVNGEDILTESSSNSVSWTPTKPGIYNILAGATDSSGDSAFMFITINVVDVVSNKTTIYYNGYSNPYIHYKVAGGSWTTAPGVKMEEYNEVEGYGYKAEIDLGEAESLTACFNNGSNSWDSNGGKNYTFGTGYYTFSNGHITEIEKPVKEFKITSFTADPSNSVCVGQDIQLKAATENNEMEVYYLFSYTNNTTSESDTISGSSDDTVTFTPETAGDYTFTVEADDGVHRISKTINYTVEEFKDIEIASLDSSLGNDIKVNKTTQLSVNAINGHGNNTYTIKVNGETILDNSSKNTVTWTPSTEGIYTVLATATDSEGVSATKTIIINVTNVTSNKTIIYYNGYSNPYIHYKVAGGSWTTAPGVKMEASSDVDGYNYMIEIDLGEAESLTACFNNGSNSWDSNGGKNYTFGIGYYTFSNGKITEIEKPVKEFSITSFTANPSNGITVGQDITLKATTENNSGNVNYCFEYVNNTTLESGVISNSEDNTVTFKPETAGQYTIKVIASDDNNTVSKTLDYTVEEFKDIEIASLDSSLGNDIKVNKTTQLSVNAINGHGNNTYTIKVNGETILDNSSKNTVTWTPNTEGIYTVLATATDSEGVSATKTMIINVINVTSNKTVIYYNGYSNPYIHYKVAGGSWTTAPGVKMEASSDVDGYNYMIEIDLGEAESLTACFNNGSNSWDSNGGKNYTFGIGYYTFSSGKITQIDEPSKTLTITSLSADKNTPQTIGEVINFTSSVKNATGEVSYKYEVTKDNITTTISEDSKAVWTPTEIGTYIVKLTVVDEANNTDTKTMTYTIKEVSQNTVTIYYSGYNNPYIHYKISGKSWTSAPGVKMDASSEISGYGYSITIDLGDADSLTACFNNGNGSWDSNGGKNYTFKVGNYTFKNGNITKIN